MAGVEARVAVHRGGVIFQRIAASHLANPLELPPLDGVSIVVTGATSGIGLEIARQLAQAGAHVVMAVRRPKVAQELIQKWQNENLEIGMPLNAEVMELDLLCLDSVVKFADAWNAHMAPLHVLINNAGIFTIGEYSSCIRDNKLFPSCIRDDQLFPVMWSLSGFQRMISKNTCK